MDNKIIKAKNNESGTITALLTEAEVSSIHVTPVPAQAPGVIVLKPGEASEEHIYYKTRDAGAGTISGLTRDYTNLNGGTGREHVNGSSWETMQSAEYINNIADAILEGYVAEQSTIAYIGATSFTVTGDVTAIYTSGRILRYNQDNTKIGVVASSSYSGGSGLTTVITGYGTVPAILTGVEFGIMPKLKPDFFNVEHNQDGSHKQPVTAKTSIVDADTMGLFDSAASFVGKYITFAILKLAFYAGIRPPQGTMWNGKIVPSVTSNNLTVALKTKSGGDPSATDPVYIMIGDTLRTVTAALSVTKNAATNWCNAGSAELATKEIDYFVYLGYNATDGVVIGFSRIPGASQYSDFSVTTTNEKYCAISTITTAASTDYYEVIGRFAATLSAGAGYTWSVPTFTAINLIQRPIYETRVLQWTPTLTGFSVNPSAGLCYEYIVRNKLVTIVNYTSNGGTSNSTNFTSTLPFTATTTGSAVAYFLPCVNTTDNSAISTTPSGILILTGGNTMRQDKGLNSAGGWTAAGVKAQNFSGITFEI